MFLHTQRGLPSFEFKKTNFLWKHHRAAQAFKALPCHANIIQRKVKVFNKAAARPLRFWEARIIY